MGAQSGKSGAGLTAGQGAKAPGVSVNGTSTSLGQGNPALRIEAREGRRGDARRPPGFAVPAHAPPGSPQALPGGRPMRAASGPHRLQDAPFLAVLGESGTSGGPQVLGGIAVAENAGVRTRDLDEQIPVRLDELSKARPAGQRTELWC